MPRFFCVLLVGAGEEHLQGVGWRRGACVEGVVLLLSAWPVTFFDAASSKGTGCEFE